MKRSVALAPSWAAIDSRPRISNHDLNARSVLILGLRLCVHSRRNEALNPRQRLPPVSLSPTPSPSFNVAYPDLTNASSPSSAFQLGHSTRTWRSEIVAGQTLWDRWRTQQAPPNRPLARRRSVGLIGGDDSTRAPTMSRPSARSGRPELVEGAAFAHHSHPTQCLVLPMWLISSPDRSAAIDRPSTSVSPSLSMSPDNSATRLTSGSSGPAPRLFH